jgi:hypothetical protein
MKIKLGFFYGIIAGIHYKRSGPRKMDHGDRIKGLVKSR